MHDDRRAQCASHRVRRSSGAFLAASLVGAASLLSVVRADAAPPQAAPGANYRPQPKGIEPDGMGQMSRISPALSAAQAWLGQLDDGDWAGTWAAADDLFRQSLSEAGWADGAKRARGALGQRRSRRLVSTQETETLAAGPDGHYVIAVYESEFERRPSAVETVTLKQSGQGAWRVSGYHIR